MHRTGTNSSKYKFYSFMVQDGFGKGQFVQHNLVDAETSVCGCDWSFDK